MEVALRVRLLLKIVAMARSVLRTIQVMDGTTEHTVFPPQVRTESVRFVPQNQIKSELTPVVKD
jgi:hypothetical protein